jgi:LPXTG-motif cell wall-anchored protein
MKKIMGILLTVAILVLSLGAMTTSATVPTPVASKLDLSAGYVDTANFAIHADVQPDSTKNQPSYNITSDGWLQLNYFGDSGYLVSKEKFLQGDFTCQFTLRNFDIAKTTTGWMGFAFGLGSTAAWWPSACIVSYDGSQNGFITYNPGVIPSTLLGEKPIAEDANALYRYWGTLDEIIAYDSRDADNSDLSLTLKYVWDHTANTLTLYTKSSNQTAFGVGRVWDKMTPPAYSDGYIGLCFTGETTLQVKDFTVVASKDATALDNAVISYKAIQPTTAGAAAAATSNVTNSSFDVSWGAMSGATSYVANVFDNSGSYIKTVAASATTASITGLTKDAQYKVQVIGLDAMGGAISYLAPLSATATASAVSSTPTSSQPPVSSSQSSSTPATTQSIPKTGTEGSIFGAIILLAVAGGTVLVIKRK